MKKADRISNNITAIPIQKANPTFIDTNKEPTPVPNAINNAAIIAKAALKVFGVSLSLFNWLISHFLLIDLSR